MNLKFLNKKEKKEILEKLKYQFGITEIPGEIVMRGKERMFLFSGSFDEKKINVLERLAPIERMGVYFAKKDENLDEIRLSIEGTQVFKDQIINNIFELPKELVEDWMKGRELNIKTGKKGFLAMRYEDDFLGTGKASEEKIGNFIPKNRRLREKS
jgi:NOL1/NOP2/fmu family ribosome biogenesis protein